MQSNNEPRNNIEDDSNSDNFSDEYAEFII